uniref:Uncharacterized protein n=1 Tax=Anguilla anguilla TaxID=7936 RepID=A0A0E9RME1_ANGAN
MEVCEWDCGDRFGMSPVGTCLRLSHETGCTVLL